MQYDRSGQHDRLPHPAARTSPAFIARRKWLLQVLFALVAIPIKAGWPQTPQPSPVGVSVRLEAKDGKTDYLKGEPIYFRLKFSADRPGYIVNSERIFGVSEQINVTPADDIFRWHGTISTDTVLLKPLTASGTSMSLRLNDAIIFKKPGTYSVSVTTRRLAEGTAPSALNWLTVTTNPVIIHIAPMPEQEEARRVDQLSSAIAKTDDSVGLDHTVEVPLACLEGDVAARKKVTLFLTGHDDITGLRRTGLALSRNKKLELQLLDTAWRSPDRIPEGYVLGEMIELRRLDKGIPVPDFGPVMAGPSKAEAVSEVAEKVQYLDEIVASLSQRQGANKTATQQFLEREKKENDRLLSIAK
jgi:hypothetical protein